MPAPVVDPTIPPIGFEHWKNLHKAADAGTYKASSEFGKAIANAHPDHALSSAITKALENGNRKRAGQLAMKVWQDASQEFRGELAGVLNGVMKQSVESVHTGMAFNVMNKRALEWSQKTAATLVTNMDGDSRLAIRQIINDGFTQGLNGETISRRLIYDGLGLQSRQVQSLASYRAVLEASELKAEKVARLVQRRRDKMVRYRARLIARTETMRASNMGLNLEWQDRIQRGLIRPNRMRKRWIVTPDDRLCPYCRSMETQTSSIVDEFENPQFGNTLVPPLHPACVIGETRVRSLRPPAAVFDRVYDGPVHVLSVAGLPPLTVTPNHPVLTSRGWVPAASLRVGDQVLCDGRWNDRRGLHEDDEHDVPLRIEDVARAFAESSTVATVQVPVSGEDFHGDAVNGEVCVVRADRALRERLDAEARYREAQNDLSFAHTGRILLPSLRDLEAALGGDLRAADRGVSSNDLLCPLHAAHSGPLQAFSLTPPANLDAGFQESSPDDVAVDPLLLGERILGDARDIVLRELVDIKLMAFHGRVYNLDSDGAYTAHGVCVQNCRCAVALERVKDGKLQKTDKLGIPHKNSLGAILNLSKGGHVAMALAQQGGKWISLYGGASIVLHAAQNPETILRYVYSATQLLKLRKGFRGLIDDVGNIVAVVDETTDAVITDIDQLKALLAGEDIVDPAILAAREAARSAAQKAAQQARRIDQIREIRQAAVRELPAPNVRVTKPIVDAYIKEIRAHHAAVKAHRFNFGVGKLRGDLKNLEDRFSKLILHEPSEHSKEVIRKVSGIRTAVGAPDTKALREGIDQFSRMVSPNTKVPNVGFGDHTARASAGRIGPDRAFLNFDRRVNAHTIVHELGHTLEYADDDLFAETVEFLRKHTRGKGRQRFEGKLALDGHYEVGFKTSYSGKIYESWDFSVGRRVQKLHDGTEVAATEVISMGMEKMARNPVKFATAEPDYFDFILHRVMHRPAVAKLADDVVDLPLAAKAQKAISKQTDDALRRADDVAGEVGDIARRADDLLATQAEIRRFAALRESVSKIPLRIIERIRDGGRALRRRIRSIKDGFRVKVTTGIRNLRPATRDIQEIRDRHKQSTKDLQPTVSEPTSDGIDQYLRVTDAYKRDVRRFRKNPGVVHLQADLQDLDDRFFLYVTRKPNDSILDTIDLSGAAKNRKFDNVQAGMRTFTRLVSPDLDVPHVVYHQKDRVPNAVRFSRRRTLLSFGDYVQPSQIVHELGHALEYANDDLFAEAVEFLAKRGKGRRVKYRAGVGEGFDYTPGFEDNYVGKIYDSFLGGPRHLGLTPDIRVRATEVVSMGLEKYARNPYKFAKTDREFFDFIRNNVVYRKARVPRPITKRQLLTGVFDDLTDMLDEMWGTKGARFDQLSDATRRSIDTLETISGQFDDVTRVRFNTLKYAHEKRLKDPLAPRARAFAESKDVVRSLAETHTAFAADRGKIRIFTRIRNRLILIRDRIRALRDRARVFRVRLAQKIRPAKVIAEVQAARKADIEKLTPAFEDPTTEGVNDYLRVLQAYDDDIERFGKRRRRTLPLRDDQKDLQYRFQEYILRKRDIANEDRIAGKIDLVGAPKTATLQSAVERFSRMVSPEVDVPHVIFRQETQRAMAFRLTKNRAAIEYNRHTPARSLIHEFAHTLEFSNDDLFEDAVQFLRTQTRGKDRRKFTGVQAVDGEYLPGFKFDYTGRIYDQLDGPRALALDDGTHVLGTEIISIGFEKMAVNPAQFALEERAFFDFIVNRVMYRGKKVPLKDTTRRIMSDVFDDAADTIFDMQFAGGDEFKRLAALADGPLEGLYNARHSMDLPSRKKLQDLMGIHRQLSDARAIGRPPTVNPYVVGRGVGEALDDLSMSARPERRDKGTRHSD